MIKIVINPPYEPLRRQITAIPADFSVTGDVIYQARNELRNINGLIVKRYRRPILINRFAYLLRSPKAVRAYQNAIRLQALGVPTPTPVAYILTYTNQLLDFSYLITDCCPYSHRMYEFGEEPITGKEAVLQAFGQFTAMLHAKGVYHLDYSPGNILWEGNEKEGFRFSLLDINRMTFQTVSEENGYRNFHRLWNTEEGMRIIARAYAQARGFDPAYAEKRVVYHWRAFWNRQRSTFPRYA